MTDEELQSALRNAGLTLDAEQRKTLLGVAPRFAAMLDRNRTRRDRSAEPAHIFKPDSQ